MPVLVFWVGLNGDRVLGGRRKILRAYEIERPSGRFALVPSGKVFPCQDAPMHYRTKYTLCHRLAYYL